MRWPLVTRRSRDEAVASMRTVGGALSEALSERDAALAEVERLTRERANWRALAAEHGREVVQLSAELDRLRKLVPDRDAKGLFVPRAKEVRRG